MYHDRYNGGEIDTSVYLYVTAVDFRVCLVCRMSQSDGGAGELGGVLLVGLCEGYHGAPGPRGTGDRRKDR